MIYKKYGEVFKMIREKHNYTLESISGHGVSKSILSKFERGEARLTLEKFISTLYYMKVSLEEYEHYLNDYYPNEWENLIDDILNASLVNDIQKLKELYILSDSLDLHFTKLAAKSSWTTLTPAESEDLTAFFYEIEIWGVKEFMVLTLTMNNIQPSDIIYIIDSFFKNDTNVLRSDKHRYYLGICCCFASLSLSLRGYKDASQNIINYVKIHNLINTMGIKNLYNATDGYWNYQFGDKNFGIRTIETSLTIYDQIASKEIALFYHRIFDEFLENSI